jgi:hypothetical protein
MAPVLEQLPAAKTATVSEWPPARSRQPPAAKTAPVFYWKRQPRVAGSHARRVTRASLASHPANHSRAKKIDESPESREWGLQNAHSPPGSLAAGESLPNPRPRPHKVLTHTSQSFMRRMWVGIGET